MQATDGLLILADGIYRLLSMVGIAELADQTDGRPISKGASGGQSGRELAEFQRDGQGRDSLLVVPHCDRASNQIAINADARRHILLTATVPPDDKTTRWNLLILKSTLKVRCIATCLTAFACIVVAATGLADEPNWITPNWDTPISHAPNEQDQLNAQSEDMGKAKRVAPRDIAEVTRELPDHGDSFETMNPFWRFRESLADSGLYTSGSITWDGTKNLRGGLDTEGFASRYLLDLILTADLDRYYGWHGATIFLDFQHHDGNLGDALVGDFQVFSNIDAPARTQIPRVWLETKWLDDKLRIKTGKIDANTEFAYTLGGGLFLNSSMGFSPTIFTMPTYPDPAGGFVAEWRSSETRSTRFGLFDGVGATGVPTGSRLPTTLLDNFEDLFVIGETDGTWGEQSAGTLGRASLGLWNHNGKFDRYDGGIQNGTWGWYATADQWLWNEGDCDAHSAQGLAAFLQIGGADQDVSQAKQHIGGGLSWTGLFEGRDTDALGIGITAVEFSSVAGTGLTARREVATELFYQMNLGNHWTATADTQYITNPGGFRERSDAVVSTLRIICGF